MAGFIIIETDSSEKEWSSANWVYCGFLDHAMGLISEDSEAVHRLTVAKYNQSIDLENLAKEHPAMDQRIRTAFELSCSQIASGEFPVSVNGNELDEESQIQYREAIRRLSKLLAAECGSGDKPIKN